MDRVVRQGRLPGVDYPGPSNERICEVEHHVLISAATATCLAEREPGIRFRPQRGRL
jgi:hypothetical protein